MKIKVAICEDEQSEIEYMSSAVSTWAKSNSHRCEIAAFSSAEAFLFENGENNYFDILLLDIEMPGRSGLELAKQLRREGNRSEIIFITSHFEFYGEGYEVDALHYLIKPIDQDKLSDVLTKAAERLAAAPLSIILNCEGETVRLYERDILYVEASLHYALIRTREREYRIKENFSAFVERLSEDFYRTHRSYLVSLKAITRISRSSVLLEGGFEIPLSRGKYDDINRAFIEHNDSIWL